MKAGLEWQVSENLDSMITVLQVFASTVVNGLILLLTTFLWNYICSPLKSFPGPVTSSFTNLWRLYDVLKGRSAKAHIELHRKHGPAVRVGPNALSVSDPRAIRKVYGCSPTWRKVSWDKSVYSLFLRQSLYQYAKTSSSCRVKDTVSLPLRLMAPLSQTSFPTGMRDGIRSIYILFENCTA